MKLQLIYKEDFDGNWHLIVKDDIIIKRIKEHPSDKGEAHEQAIAEYERIRDFEIKETIIREDEI